MAEGQAKIIITGDATGLKAAAGQASASLGELKKTVSDEAKGNEENAKKTEFLTLKKTELKKLVRELGQEFPIARSAQHDFLPGIEARYPRFTVEGLTGGQTYYFSVLAVARDGRESKYSNEVRYELPRVRMSPAPAVPIPLRS